MGHQTLFQSSKYKNFITDRDKVLEKIHQNAQTDISRITFDLLDQVEKEISHLLLFRNEDNAIELGNKFEKESIHLFSIYIHRFVDRIESMRKSVYTLTYLGEQEAIGQATKRKKEQTPAEFKSKVQKSVKAKTLLDEDLTKRVWVNLMILRGRILDRLRLGLVQELSPKEIIASVKKQFPDIQAYRRPPRELKEFKEAGLEPKDKFEYSYDFADDDTWNTTVDAYINTELPPSRFDNASGFDPEAGYFKYNWEMEQGLTDDFVNQVRSGQIDAANDLGIQDFVWVAILDKRTDDCCENRNGKLTSEIEQMLESGELDADECDATSPPAHPNCRCQLDPSASTDEVEGPDWKSFNDWLNT